MHQLHVLLLCICISSLCHGCIIHSPRHVLSSRLAIQLLLLLFVLLLLL